MNENEVNNRSFKMLKGERCEKYEKSSTSNRIDDIFKKKNAQLIRSLQENRYYINNM